MRSDRSPLRAAIYARVSTAEQATHGTSLETQRECCRAFVAANGWSVVGEWVDEGVSGATASRPRLNALFDAVTAGRVDVVIVARLDRFARSMNHLSTMIAELDEHDVLFATVDRQVDTTTSTGRLLRNILGSFAEFERELIIERTAVGKRKAVQNGFWPGGVAPYGWRSVRDETGHARLVLMEAQAEAYRLIVSLLVDKGYTTGEAARHMNDLGISAPRGGQWHQTELRHLLTRAPLDGRWIYKRPPSHPHDNDGEMLSVDIPPILNLNRYAELQRALARSSTGPRGPARLRVYLLGRKRMRSVCGGSFHGVWRKDRNYRQYRCANSLANVEPRCGCHRLRADHVEKVAWDTLVDFLSDQRSLLAAAQRHAGAKINEAARSTALAAINAETARLERAIVRVTIDYAEADQPPQSLRIATDELRSRLSTLERQRRQFTNESRRIDDIARRAQDLERIARAAGSLRDLDLIEQSRVFALLDVHVKVIAWSRCPACHGNGKVTGTRGGRSCPTCHGSRFTARCRLDGTLSDSAIIRITGRTKRTPARSSADTLRFRCTFDLGRSEPS